jgi:hypothetical protein
MNTAELDSYSLDDAVKFNQNLNPRLWDKQRMRPEVRAKLLDIAADFKQSLGLTDLEVKDITVSGSNAGFTYTPHSDIDLHLVVDIPQADVSDVYRELFDAKKYQYNAEHNITIGGYDVELYVENANQPPVSQGVYSIVHDDWINIPKRRRSTIDDDAVRSKYADIKHRIQSALDSRDHEQISAMAAKIKKMRTAGLASNGEMGPENLAYKMLRSQGWIKKLYDAKTAARDLELSLNERKKKKKRVRYGFWSPGFSFGDSEGGDAGGGGESIREVSVTPDGVSPSTKMFLEQDSAKDVDILKSFAKYVGSELGLAKMPRIIVKRKPNWAEQNGSFGQYAPELNQLTLSLHGRHIVDVLRTLAHELTHAHQQQTTGIPDNGGETGSDFENEANARAGEFMRHFADAHPEYFDTRTLEEGLIKNAGAAVALAAAMSMTPAQAQQYLPQDQQQQVQQQGQLSTMQILNIARTIHSLKHNVTRAGAEEEINQEIKNYMRAQQGDAGAQNLSRLWQLQQRQQQKQQPQQQPWTGNQYQRESVSESSGYIPTEAEKNDPRFVMALSPDVKPGATGKNANKMSLRTNAQGQPQLAKTNGLVESMKREFARFAAAEDYSPDAPPGPESPPTMPAGTVRIDVSDMYDWYKLGQHISNMKGLGKHDFGAGPPSSVISFGDEETEHKFIKDLKATGLDVTDIDPKDVKQPAGMPKIKTDPTYNVDEDELVESLRQEFALLEDEFLGEIKMTGKNLRAEAAKTGAIAGMEFEMIVPNIEQDLEPEYEPDWDQDQRSRSFGDVRDFFYDGDYNSRRDADRLIEELDGEYQEWKQEQIAEAWERDGADYVRDYVANNDLFDRDEAMLQARDEIIDANPDLPPESEEFTELLSARLNEMETEFADTAFEDRGRIHDQAFEEFSDEQDEEYDERSFLDDKYQTMSDIQSNFDISWPHYYDINDGQDGEMDIDQVADDFSNSIGKPVNASRQYHGGRREAGHYVVEPDGSLEGDNPGDGGLEFVSPPMPIDEMISDLNKVKAWAKREGCYTNDSTGLHINISVPNYTLAKLDYVKLALLMGDEYVLELFGRSGNTYAKSAIGKIKTMLQRNPDIAPQVMDKMREHMEDIATKAIHSGTTDKYTSINTKTGYIEFRSPGGDWLDANFDKIENTLLRFTVALSAAIDPKAYRQEYLKKLYKLLEGSQAKGGPDVLQLFANYSAGELDKAALIRQVRQKQLARNVDKGKATGKMWWSVGRPGYGASAEVVASSKEEAIEKGKQEYPDWRDARDMTAKPLRPYQEPQTPEAEGPTLNGRPSNPDGRWIIIDRRDRDTPVYRYAAADSNDAFNVLRQWIAANPGGEWMYAQDPTQRLGQPQAQQPAVSTDQGNWGIWIVNADRFANQPGSYSRSETPPFYRFPTRAAAEQWIEQQRAARPNMRSDIEVREIEPTAQTGSRNALSQTDIENRLGWGGQEADANYEVIDRRTQQPVFKFIANTEQDAARKYDQYLDVMMLPQETEDYGFREIAVPGSTLDLQRQRGTDANTNSLRPTGPGPWEVANRANNQVYYNPPSSNRIEAGSQSLTWLRQNGHNEADFEVRTREGANSDTTQGGIIDIEPDISQYAAPQTLTRPGQPQQTFTGEWMVLDPQDQEIYRFSGVGNNQSDANRVAMNWLRQNPGRMQAGVTVVPVMG